MTTQVQSISPRLKDGFARFANAAFAIKTQVLAPSETPPPQKARIAKPSELRQAEPTNNVISQGFVGQLKASTVQRSPLMVRMPMKEKGIRSCAAKVTSNREHGTRLALYWAVPRQGYNRN